MTPPRRKPLKLALETLEPRQLLSRAGERILPFRATPALGYTTHQQSVSPRPDLDAFALELAYHPRVAARMGLSGLAQELDRHSGFAARYGWGACLAMELSTHPRYAAAHHLTALMNPAQPSRSVAPTPVQPTGAGGQGPTPQAFDPSVAVGSTLDTTVPNGGLSGPKLTYTITPQPLPANMTFNRGTGELVFVPAPNQVGTYNFNVTVSDGTHSVSEKVPVTVTKPVVPSTEVSGQVVDESGNPLAGITVMVGSRMGLTDASGGFTLTGLSTTSAPLTVDGLQTATSDRMMVMVPDDQILGHPVYANANNVVAKPILLPRIDVAHAADLSKFDPTKPLDVTNPALPGVHLTLPAHSAVTGLGTPFLGKLVLTNLPASEVSELLPPGVVAGLIEVDAIGLRLNQPVRLTMPNSSGYAPGSMLNLWTMNWTTGGHDVVGHMVVSSDGKSMTSMGGVAIPSGSMSMGLHGMSAGGIHALDIPVTSGCLIVTPQPPGQGDPNQLCDCGQPGANASSPAPGTGNNAPGTGTNPDPYSRVHANGVPAPGTGSNPDPYSIVHSNGVLGSDAGMVTGEYFQDHATASYQSQGQSRDLVFEYSSLQADPRPVVQFDPSTQIASNSAAIGTITAQITLAGVVQGNAVTYTPSSLQDGAKFRIPLQVDASQLATGAYPYTITVTANYQQEFYSGPGLSQTYQGWVNVVNGVVTGGTANPLGAGWSVGGVQRISLPDPNGPALITAGSQGTVRFDQHYANGQGVLQDLAVASGSDTRVYTNDGLGNFMAGTPASTGTPVGTVAGDFNGDGRPDLAEVTGSTLTILLNNGAGGFIARSSYALPFGDTAEAVAAGNFTGHTGAVRDLAVLVNTGSGDAVAVFTANGDGTFAAPVFTSLGNGLSGAATMAASDFNGDGKDDLAITTGDGLLDVDLATTGGALTSSAVTLPTGHLAIGVIAVDYNSDGKTDLIVEASNTNISDGAGTFVNLDLYTGSGSGGFSYTSTYSTGGHPDQATTGLVAGNFAGGYTIEVAVPLGGDSLSGVFMDVVPLSPVGAWTQGVLIQAGPTGSASSPGNIVAADFNGTGRPSLAWTDGSGQIRTLSADPASNQFLQVETVGSGSGAVMLTAAPFVSHVASRIFTGPMGDTSTLLHNLDGTWTRSYADGTVVRFDTAGRETSVADRNGNTTSYAYVATGPAAGALQTVSDPVGLVTTLAYDANGHLSTVTDPAGRVTRFTVDAGGNLTQITDPDNAVTQYGYGTPANHRITTETNPNNHTATAHYDSFGRLSSETLFDGTSTTQVGAALEQGLLAPGGSGPLPLPSNFTGTVTDPNGHATSLLFDNMNDVIGTTDGNGKSTSDTRDMMGWVSSFTDELNRTTTFTHDMKGNVTSITRPGNYGQSGLVETITYDPTYSVPTSVTDFRGLTTTYTLDTHGNVLRRTDPDGLHEDWTYNTAGQMLTDTDRNGHATTYHYDAYGRPDQVTHPAGTGTGSDVATGGTASASSENPGGGEGAAQAFDQDPGTKWVAFATSAWLQYDLGAGVARTVTTYRLVSAYDTSTYTGRAPRDWQLQGSNDGSSWAVLDTRTNQADTVSFDTRTNSVASPGSYRYYRLNVTANNGDPGVTQLADLQLVAASPTPVSVPASSVSIGYDAAGNVTRTTDELGHISYATYDPMDRVLTTQDPVQAAAGPAVKTTYAYDPAGNLTSVTDPLGHVTSFGHDARNRLVSVVDPFNQGTGRQWTYGYDARGDLTSVTDPLGHAVTYGYDNDNRLTTTTDALNHTWTTGYDDAGEVTRRTDPNGHAETDTYDVIGRLQTVSLPASGGYGYPQVVATYAYDSDDNVTSVTDALGHATSYNYDHMNRLIRVTDALGHATSYAFDPAGNRTSVTDPLGHTTTDYYDVRDRLIAEVARAGGGTTSYAYDDHSRLTGLTDPVGNVTSWGYDNADRVTTETDPRTKVTSYVYDYVGNLTQKTDRDNRVTQYGYDADNRPTTETWVGASPPNTVTTTYDAAGRVTGISDANSAYAYGYDNANRLTSVDNQGTPGVPHVVLTSGYDNAGNRTSMTDSLGGVTGYAYDSRNQLTSLTQSGTGVAPKRADFTYDGAGRRTSLTRYSDLAGSTTVLATAYTYDDANRLTGLTHETALSGGTVRASYGYTLDAADRLTSESRTWNSGASTDAVSYAYTNDNQLTSVAHTNGAFANESFGYDANGNRNTTGYSTGTGNRLSSDGTYSYGYDDEGNLTSKTKISDGSQTVYKWDFHNRLTEVDSVVSGVTTVLATYTYDALDRLIKVVEGGTTRSTLYDGMSPVLDFNGSGTQTARYLNGAAVDEILARETSGGTVAWYLADRLGTVRDLVDNTGTVIDHVDYGVFGNPTNETSPSNGDRFKFAQLQWDSVSALNFAALRTEDPVTGRWTSEDPIGVRFGSNGFSYSFNEPNRLTDFLGLFPGSGPPFFNQKDGEMDGMLDQNPNYINSDLIHNCPALEYWINAFKASILSRTPKDNKNKDPNHIERNNLEREYLRRLIGFWLDENCGGNLPVKPENPPSGPPPMPLYGSTYVGKPAHYGQAGNYIRMLPSLTANQGNGPTISALPRPGQPWIGQPYTPLQQPSYLSPPYYQQSPAYTGNNSVGYPQNSPIYRPNINIGSGGPAPVGIAK
jgi:RHS repeat-associated protein